MLGTVLSLSGIVGAMTSTTNLSDVLFSDLIGASDGKFFGDSISGARKEETGVGALAMGGGLERLPESGKRMTLVQVQVAEMEIFRMT